jgi:hypothetical protein
MDKQIIIKDNFEISTNASASAFGWDFQRNAAIILMLLNLKNTKSIRVEGENDDIEIKLNNEKVIYSQAKAVNDPYNTNPLNKNLEASLRTLESDSKMPDVEQLVFITNSPNPFNNKNTIPAFSSGLNIYNYNELPEPCKIKLDSIINKKKYTMNKNLLFVYVMQFPNSNYENRYKVISERISSLCAELSMSNYSNIILEIWQNEFFKNSTLSNHKASLTKEQMIWPIIVLECELTPNHPSLEDIDVAEYNEILRKYSSIINNHAERFLFITHIINSFNEFDNSIKKNRKEVFIESSWRKFESEFFLNDTDEILKEKIIKITLGIILNNRFIIDRIKKGVNL